MDSSNITFTSFSDYEHKLQSYVKNLGLDDTYQQYRLVGIKRMAKEQDFDQLAYLMWLLPKEFEILLNNGSLEIDLDALGKTILGNNPSISITGCRGLTPLGGFSAAFQGALDEYSVLKFIIQFTNSQDIFDKCWIILNSMPPKLSGPGLILNPADTLVLASYNSHIVIDDNKLQQLEKIKPHCDTYIEKSTVFYNSIYYPPPSTEAQYNRYKREIQQAYYDLALETKDNLAAYLCLVNCIMRSHWNVAKNMNELRLRILVKISDETFDTIKQMLLDISNQHPIIDHEKMRDQVINQKITDTFRFVRSSDDNGDITSIFIRAICYVKDDKYNVEVLKRKLLTELYERKIIEFDSEHSHNLLREAVESGVIWIVKFLVAGGCPTKNLPSYGGWDLKSKQLDRIADEEINDDRWGMSAENIAKKKESQIKMRKYLLQNNLI